MLSPDLNKEIEKAFSDLIEKLPEAAREVWLRAAKEWVEQRLHKKDTVQEATDVVHTAFAMLLASHPYRQN
jgi:hypothetical protein